ncbi:MAG TPA: hydantoinase/carbamoylase family amidase [Acetobacteraceae bacterium]|nr:hydantoinase/carbamoylase family amidase [Acetobacteraceae bacterium]
MRANLTPDVELAARLFDALRAKTFDGVGITREAYGPGEQAAHALVRAEAEALSLDIANDAAGNLYLTLPGADRSAKRIVLGSHLDSVAQGGNYDGAAGVLAGMATVAGMRAAGFQPSRDITVLAIRAEEAGAWFPTSYPGSRAALGRLPPDVLAIRRMDSGRSLEDHMRELGFDPDAVRVGRGTLSAANTAAYLELHIEQGPVLDGEGIPVGVVSGIPGSRRLRAARVVGEYNHSGATPRRYRRDAAIALAELAHRLDEHWAALETQGHRLVCTFCVLATTEGAGFTKIPGEARFQLDVRSVQQASVDAMFAELHRLIASIEARRGVRFELGEETGSQPSPMDAGVQQGLVRAAEALGVAYRVMPSGGGHDAAAFAQAGVPAGMLFVRNQNGSHNPHEAMRMEDFAAGCAVVTRWAADMAG